MPARARAARSHPELRSVSLRVHLGLRARAWVWMSRTSRGVESFDSRVGAGQYTPSPTPPGVPPQLHALREALIDAYRRAGAPWPEASRGPLGGIRGGPETDQEDLEAAFSVSELDRSIDTRAAP